MEPKDTRCDSICKINNNYQQNLNTYQNVLEEQKKAKKISKRSKEIINSIQEMKSELDNCVENGWLDITSGLSRKEGDK